MSVELPVVFLAFANNQDDYLAALKAESRAAFSILQPLAQQGLIEIHREESSTSEELYSDLLAHHGKVVLFHYAGHADGQSLWLEGGKGSASGIAHLLATQSDLRLVFLNGCATLDQVKELHAAGVPAVIATSVKIDDDRATRFSSAFYEALAAQHSLFESFELACAYLETHSGDGLSPKINRYPRFDFEQEEEASDDFEWGLYVREDCREELGQWRLTEAREQWRLSLNDSKGPVRNLDGNPLLLDYRTRQRTVDVSLCAQCGSTVASSGISICPVCQSTDLSRSKQSTQIPDLFLPTTLREDEVTKNIESALHPRGPSVLSLKLIYFPYWAFDIDSRVALTGERGVVKDVSAENLDYSWESVKEEFVLQLKNFAVPAASPQHLGNNDWDWSLEKARPLESLEDAAQTVPSEQPLETCFKTVAALLDNEIKAETSDRIGGLQQRNKTTDVRYGTIKARLVLLPLWYATVEIDGRRSSLLIHGISGEMQNPTVAGTKPLNEEIKLPMSQAIQRPGASADRASSLVSVFAGIGIGVMIGLLLGLAAPGAKTVVSVFIGAVGVGLAALLGLNDRHFSNAKGLRIGAFGLAVAFSAMAGIYVRDHGLISPDLQERANEVRSVFPSLEGKEKDERVIEILSAMDSHTSTEGKKGKTGINLRSLQYSGKEEAKSICENLQSMSRENLDDTAKLTLRNFRYYDKDGSLGWSGLADFAEKNLPEKDVKNFLLLSRDSICGGGLLSDPVKLDRDACKSAGSTDIDWRTRLAESDSGRAVLDAVSTELSAGTQVQSLEAIGKALCRVNTDD